MIPITKAPEGECLPCPASTGLALPQGSEPPRAEKSREEMRAG